MEGSNTDTEFKILGVCYNTETDETWCTFSNAKDFQPKKRIKKRHLAGIVARLFDPCGKLAPFTLRLKRMWQEYLENNPKAKWDSDVTVEERKKWEDIIEEAEKLKNIRTPRLAFLPEATAHHVHTFGDASGDAIAVCTYIVNEVEGKLLQPRLIGAKSKMVPTKQQKTDRRTTETFINKYGPIFKDFAPAINRLELGAATMCASTTAKLCTLLNLKLEDVTFWTDSENTIRYINKGENGQFLTKNNKAKVEHILRHTRPEQWLHISGKINPADKASKEMSEQEISTSSLWWHGPDFLTLPKDKWPEQKPELRTPAKQTGEPMEAPIMITVDIKENNETILSKIVPLTIPLKAINPDDHSPKIKERRKNSPAVDLALTKDTWKLSLQAADQKIFKEEAYKHLRCLKGTAIDWNGILQLLVIQEAQQKWDKPLWTALKKNKIPKEDTNLVFQNNLQFMKLEGIELIVSVPRPISRPLRKLTETLRRQEIPARRQDRKKKDRNEEILSKIVPITIPLKAVNLAHISKKKETSPKVPMLQDSTAERPLLPCANHLIYIPWSSPTARKLVRHLHMTWGHASRNIVEIEAKKSYFIPKISKIYKMMRKKCTQCRLIDAKPYKLPEGDLPFERTFTQKPFDVVGVDFTGPFKMIMPQAANFEPSIIIFTCAYTRAVSLQPCVDQTFESFQRAYSKFIYTRGARPKLIRSDNGSAFTFSQKVMTALESAYSASWNFNPPKAPWWGGFFERLIGMVKGKMAYCFNRRRFASYEDFTVATAYLEYLLNNRPIHISEDPVTGNKVAIRPAQFINPGHEDNFDQNIANIIQPLKEDSMSALDMGRRLKRQHNLFKRIKHVFETEYIDHLRKWHTNKMFARRKEDEAKIDINDVILIKPDKPFKEKSPWQKTKWQVGKVLKIDRLRNGRIRTIDAEIMDKHGKRHIRQGYPPQAFAPLELPKEDQKSKKTLDEILDFLNTPVPIGIPSEESNQNIQDVNSEEMEFSDNSSNGDNGDNEISSEEE